jgi:hypothetical protein
MRLAVIGPGGSVFFRVVEFIMVFPVSRSCLWWPVGEVCYRPSTATPVSEAEVTS